MCEVHTCYSIWRDLNDEEAAPGTVARGHAGATDDNTFDEPAPAYAQLVRIDGVDVSALKSAKGALWVSLSLSGLLQSFGLSGGVGGAAGALSGGFASDTGFSTSVGSAADAALGAVTGAIW